VSTEASSARADRSSFDLVVIGAGINGAAIAREAAVAGLRALLLDRGDLGSGTSSTSSRLIHGGLRYLEYAELGLVYESLAERERLLATAPHLVEPLELYVPVYRRARRKLWQISVGLTLYDWLSYGRSLPGHRTLAREALVAQLPGLERTDLVGGGSYFDAQARFPERLVLENVRDAVDCGATVRTYSEALALRVEQRRVVGVEWRDARGSRVFTPAAVVVNAAGPWVDRVLGPLPHTRLIGGTKGSHLIVPPFPGAPRAGVYVEAGSDARPLFILPWNDLYLIGTTDERFEGDPAEARLERHELDYLVAETERVFPRAAGLQGRVLYTYTGVRPLPYQPGAAEGAVTRAHLVRRHRAAKGLYSIVGGKLTTHRALAEDVLRRLRRDFPQLPRRSPTRGRALPGALPESELPEFLAEVGAALGAEQASRLWRIYGRGAAAIAELAKTAELGTPLEAPGGTLVAELVHALEREWAQSLIDILQRRSMRGLSADFGRGAAAPAAEWLVRLGLWDRPRAERELADYAAYAARHAPPS
jgi:glycerol-3-phosphate dehydrogenase